LMTQMGIKAVDVRAAQEDITQVQADVIIVNLFEGVTEPGGATGAADRASGGLISRLITSQEVTGKFNETTVLYAIGVNAPKVVIVGLGKREGLDHERIRQAAGSAIRAAAGAGRARAKTVATVVHGAGLGGLDAGGCGQAVVEGFLLGAYQYQDFKGDKNASIDQLIVVENDEAKLPLIEQGVMRGRVLAEATNHARDLVNAPANTMTPSDLAEVATSVARRGGLTIEVLDEDDMKRLGMGALLGVAQGSDEPPKLIVMKHTGREDADTLALVGKGITFDSGGISIKGREGMHYMKNDMAGAAAVIGAMEAIGRLKPGRNVVAIVPCTENLPSGSALKPGDVLRAMNGKTIEIISTDAEGRLVLADGVAYAASLGVSRIVDVATLTGACGVALGPFRSGVVSSCDPLAQGIAGASARSGERFWRFPSDRDYLELLESDVADLKNSGGRLGGAIVGGLFIGEFAGDACWAHLDIANTCFSDKTRGYQPKGATGVAVRTLVELALS